MNLSLRNNNKFIKFYHVKKTSELRDPLFRAKIIKQYKKCIVSDIYNKSELEACHIVPLHWLTFKNNKLIEGKNINDISNGILLNKFLHTTFDKYYWSIEPKTFHIEINPNIIEQELGHIIKYNGKKLLLEGIDDYFLTIRYKIFKRKINLMKN